MNFYELVMGLCNYIEEFYIKLMFSIFFFFSLILKLRIFFKYFFNSKVFKIANLLFYLHEIFFSRI